MKVYYRSYVICMDIYIHTQIKGKESENSYQELKRSPKDSHTQTHGNCIEVNLR